MKLEHEGPIALSGTGLTAIAESEGQQTIAAVTGDLSQMCGKISDYGYSPLAEGRDPRNASIGRLKTIRQLDPKERLSPALLDAYEAMIRQGHVTVEIEMISLAAGPRQRKEDLKDKHVRLIKALEHGVRGRVFEYETDDHVRRLVIQCTGDLYRELVEEPQWRDVIFSFEEKPRFETFHERWEHLSASNLRQRSEERRVG